MRLNITEEDKKQGSGVIKDMELPKEFSIKELIKYSLQNSDNTAYLKLVSFIGKEKLIQYGKSLGAQHTLEGKDNFGLINCTDLAIYWKKMDELLKKAEEIKEWLLYPTIQIIKEKSLYKIPFFRKYGAYGISFHEGGIVRDTKPYLLIVLTQMGNNKKSKKFINKAAKKMAKIHKKENEGEVV